MPDSFDYIIIGGGLAGLQLALRFAEDPYFNNKQFAIIDPSDKTENDKTWCFWEKGKGNWESIIYKSWESGRFLTSSKYLKFQLEPYKYKMIRSEDFYSLAKDRLQSLNNFHFIKDSISEIDEPTMIAHGAKQYEATHFFDSRINPSYLKDKKSSLLYQHFKGWIIETDSNIFDPDQFTMMDYRLKHNNSTSFTYMLPLSRTKALIEFTFFTPYLTEESVYDEMLMSYIKEYLGVDQFHISETEIGVIPMTDFPFHKDNTPSITKIGTAGSWVKGSTGYSFKHTEKKTAKIVANIKAGKEPSYELLNSRFRWYDAIFLDVLTRNNEMGEEIFSKFYSKNSTKNILKYLDEETSLSEDLKIMFSLFDVEFIKSFFRKGI